MLAPRLVAGLLTLTLALLALSWALAFFAGIACSRLSRLALLPLLLILALPGCTRRILALLLLLVGIILGVASLARGRLRCVTVAIRRLVSGGLGDLAIELVAEVLELGLGSLQGGGFVAQHAAGCSLDAFAQPGRRPCPGAFRDALAASSPIPRSTSC